MSTTITQAAESHSRQFNHINGNKNDLLNRLAISELCKGWPVYRDASEWMNFRSLFTDDATVWTTWSGPRSVEDFIAISKAGKEAGAFIQHRECGTLVEINQAQDRAIGKMKATITQRFVSPESIAYDIDCDCRFIFFCQQVQTGGEKVTGHGEWKIRFAKLIYEKDKVVPVDGRSAPSFAKDVLEKYPLGYRYLGAAQAELGYDVVRDLATVRDLGTWKRMYVCMEKWLKGENPDLFW